MPARARLDHESHDFEAVTRVLNSEAFDRWVGDRCRIFGARVVASREGRGLVVAREHPRRLRDDGAVGRRCWRLRVRADRDEQRGSKREPANHLWCAVEMVHTGSERYR